MRQALGLIGVFVLLSSQGTGQENQPPKDYTEFSRLVHGIVVKQLPKDVEDASGWGGTIPVEANLPFPKLRKYVKVGEKMEMPHGTWRKFRGKLEDPAKNLKIIVKDFKQLDGKTYRIVTDVDVTFLAQAELQQWQKGLFVVGAEVAADANLTGAIVCDVGVSLNLKKFPPELVLEPKVTELGLDFVDFKVRGGPFIVGEFGDNLRRDLKETFRSIVKASEPLVKIYVNDAIAQSLKEGKGSISAEAILKAMPR